MTHDILDWAIGASRDADLCCHIRHFELLPPAAAGAPPLLIVGRIQARAMQARVVQARAIAGTGDAGAGDAGTGDAGAGDPNAGDPNTGDPMETSVGNRHFDTLGPNGQSDTMEAVPN